ncbi:hypothetical protein GCM10009563_24300 [Subtercola frigoramans]
MYVASMMNVPRMSGRQLVLNTRATGTAATSPASMTFWKAGVSTSLKRTYSPITTSTALAMNGTRQPQLAKSAADMPRFSQRNTPLAMMKPIGAPSCGKVP